VRGGASFLEARGSQNVLETTIAFVTRVFVIVT